MAELGIVCGLAAEARALGRWARDPRVTVAITGARADAAEARARLMAAEGARLLVSWGIAGGLAPALVPGSVVIGREVVSEAGERLALHLPPDRWGQTLLGAEQPAATAGEKARLHAETGADAVDLESLAVARIAAETGLPALAIRAVADPAGRSLPRFVTDAVTAEGRPRLVPVLVGIALNSDALPALWRLRLDTRRALEALRRFADTELSAVLARDYSSG